MTVGNELMNDADARTSRTPGEGPDQEATPAFDRTRIAALAHGDPCLAGMEVRFNARLENPIFGFTLHNEVGSTVFATSTDHRHGDTGHFEPGDSVVVRMAFENWLTPSRYSLTPSIARHGTGADALDLREDIASLLVHSGHFTGGVVDLPHGFEISGA